LLNLAVGLTVPSAGGVTVLGGRPPGSPAALDGIAFVAQDTPLYKNLSAGDMLHLTRNLNRRFDQASAEARLAELGIPLKQKAGKISGGQQAQLALTLALARRPRLLVLDEPVAMLDPIARHDFMATVLTAAADDGVSVLLSSHVLAELERVADYLILVSRGRVQVAGEVDDLLASHRMLTGPAAEAGTYAERPVVHVRRAEAQAHLLVRAAADDPVPPGWEAHPVGLEELALAYLREPGATALPGPARAEDAEPSEVTK
jgi:ABC-2 type transport system ATP-binding protein